MAGERRNGADLAIFVATSGHSGVDRIIGKLVPAFARRGDLTVDVLQIRGHGPSWETPPRGVNLIPLNASHVNTSFLPLLRYLRRRRPRVLLTDKDKVNRLALWARRLTGAPDRLAIRMGTTVSENLAAKSRLTRWSQYGSIRLLYGWADRIIVPSRGVADDLAAIARLPVERIDVIHNPVVDEALQQAAGEPVDHPWFADTEIPVVLGVGALIERKRFATLIRAFAALRRRRACRLVILGRGRQHRMLRALADELGVGEDVDLPGFKDNPYAYMARASVFALTSAWEGSGIVLVEAMATGTPVVSTDCPSGPAETLDNGRYGELVPVDDWQRLAEALERTLDAPPDPGLLREGAARFTVEASARRYLEVLGLA